MSQPVLLFVDLLGAKARWHVGGRVAAQRAFKTLETIVVRAIEQYDGDAPLGGFIETDSAALVFESLPIAVPFAQRLFVDTFVAPKSYSDERLWLRGVIVPYRGNLKFRHRVRQSVLPPSIQVTRLENSVLDAVAAEKAGFRGMRVLIGGGRGTGRAMRDAAAERLRAGNRLPQPFLRLRTPQYPSRLVRGRFCDFFWMGSNDRDQIRLLNDAMANRLRWGSGNAEEFVQAAATQVVFNLWRAFAASLGYEV